MLEVSFFPGASAISAFRRDRLLSALNGADIPARSLSCSWAYLVCPRPVQVVAGSSSKQVSLSVYEELAPLLDLQGTGFSAAAGDCLRLWVFPRHGTLSPWASKALDIVQRCGLTPLNRLERGVCFDLQFGKQVSDQVAQGLQAFIQSEKGQGLFFDRMTEEVFFNEPPLHLVEQPSVKPLEMIELSGDSNQRLTQLQAVNDRLGLALSTDEMDYLVQAYQAMNRHPTDVELMMFAQANSEHCRHKIFNASFIINSTPQERSLFQMIRHTHAVSGQGTVSAYEDNAAILQGRPAIHLQASVAKPGPYQEVHGLMHTVLKAETHNHPTAISPFPGAATGAGGEIRDEGATGRGAEPRAGLVGFSVSGIDFSGEFDGPSRQASPLQIMLEGPIGAAAFNNEFGRPGLLGYFRSFELGFDQRRWGYHKPIMLAGGVGVIHDDLSFKKPIPEGALLVQLGGPGMRIGLGGGAASSVDSGVNSAQLDFDSVQRGNPEMQRRAQEVIDACVALGPNNPILSIHDVGAGGLSNAFPELVHGAGMGADFQLSQVPIEDHSMSPAEVWCNESQERYVLAISEEHLPLFQSLAQRERCPFAVVGRAHSQDRLRLLAPQPEASVQPHEMTEVSKNPTDPVDMPLSVLLGKPPRMQRNVERHQTSAEPLDLVGHSLEDCIHKVLAHPTVASKEFLITIGDRTVGGLTARDQMVGPWQTPVADAAITLWDFKGFGGQAIALGERQPLAVTDSVASVRMALGEALTNLFSAPVDDLANVKLCANWMAACGEKGQDAALYDAVQNLAMELCPQLGLSIPVGKDSLSMRTGWDDSGQKRSVISPVSLVLTAVTPVEDVRQAWTPVLRADRGDTVLILIDLAAGKQRMGGSILAQLLGEFGGEAPNLDDAESLRRLHRVCQEARSHEGLVFAYHDRSDGGLLACLAEMAFAGRCGLTLNLDLLTIDPVAADWGDFKIRPEQVAVQRDELTLKALFNEELGVVLQVARERRSEFMDILRKHGLSSSAHEIGYANTRDQIEIYRDAKCVFQQPRARLQESWTTVSFEFTSRRDNPVLAKQAFEALHPPKAPEVYLPQPLARRLSELGSATQEGKGSAAVTSVALALSKPRIAILREQGVNGQVEMAAAFEAAGFEAWDVHMTDLLERRIDLDSMAGLVACGGFSFGDVLGAGNGWASSILLNNSLRDTFTAFFERQDRFALGVCNGCQMMARLRSIIPGAEGWPTFLPNASEQFEARLSMVEVLESNSIFFQDMQGARLPVVVSHGEGRASWGEGKEARVQSHGALRFTDDGKPAHLYPANPNGSPDGLTGFTNEDGRVLVLMPHPERVFRNVQFSWAPESFKTFNDFSPWAVFFKNAYEWVRKV
ncbi:MAG: phosphoribosylformylglycinamidine synthase [Burkholderiaceae bacterium]